MKNNLKIGFALVAITTIISCSTRKDTFINRNFHAVTTKYNVLFNGEEAFKKGLEEISSKNEDNFWKRLSIEPITFDEDKIEIPKFGPDPEEEEEENKNLPAFEKAEQKAVKAIQKHTMNIGGVERNRKIDDAYLLLGKSRYYTQRFIPAIEAFNYVIDNYPYANLINETKIWRAKTNIRLENEETSIASLKALLDRKEEEKELSDKIKEKAHTAMAMAYEKTDTIQKVIEHLTKATATHVNKEQTARNLFVLGQIYSQLNRKDSATMVFQKLADFKKAPYKYRIHANIEMVKNTTKDSSSTALIKKFKKLIKNRDNRPYLDELYYQIGALEEQKGNNESAMDYYQQSLKAKDGGDYQKTYTYERLGSINFDKANFILASAYYDSVLQVAKEDVKNEKRIRSVKRKHKGLATLIKYEEVLTTNDSILTIAAMPESAQTEYFESYIAKLKKADEELKQQQLNAVSSGGSSGGGASVNNNTGGKWYFYNNQVKSFGEVEFQKIWGTRPLEDNWRYSDKTSISSASSVSAEKGENTQLNKYDLASYLERIPKTKKAIDSLTIDRNDALYQLGLIYKEQFKNPDLAIRNLERLQTLNPDEKLKLPINYHLYQIYSENNNSEKANQYKDVILNEFGDSKYAQIIKFPKKKLAENTAINKIEEAYKEVYYLYKKDKYAAVVSKIDKLIPTLQQSELLPKFELLKAYALGKHKDKETYKKAMEFVALSYANTEEGKKAKQIVDKLK